MSVLRAELVKLREARGNFVANTMDLEQEFKSELEALRDFDKQIEGFVGILNESASIVADRLEILERKEDGAIQGL